MARSTRKPYGYFCTGNPQKDRAQGRRSFRAASSRALRILNLDPEGADDFTFPTRNEVDNPWSWSVDGKPTYCGDTEFLPGYAEKIRRK